MSSDLVLFFDDSSDEEEVFVGDERGLDIVSQSLSNKLIEAAGLGAETPIVDALVGNLTRPISLKKNSSETIKCNICNCELSSSIVLGFHVNGSRHKKKLKSLEIMRQLKNKKNSKFDRLTPSQVNTTAFRCEVCNITMNSAQQLEVHLSGSKHRKKSAKVAPPEPEPNPATAEEILEHLEKDCSTSSKKLKKEDVKVLTCYICNVFMNSPTQYDQHLLSKKHMHKINQLQKKRLSRRRKAIQQYQFNTNNVDDLSENPDTYQDDFPSFNPMTYKRMFTYYSTGMKPNFYDW